MSVWISVHSYTVRTPPATAVHRAHCTLRSDTQRQLQLIRDVDRRRCYTLRAPVRRSNSRDRLAQHIRRVDPMTQLFDLRPAHLFLPSRDPTALIAA